MSQIWIEVDKDARVECQCCDWTGKGYELEMVTDIEQRIAPGETVPAGQCPACGALAHLID